MPEAPIQIHDVKKAFGQQVVLDGISFEVAAGEAVAVLGRSGTGKSVLLKLLVGLLQPDSGSLTINGEQVNNLGEQQLNAVRKKMGFLFQGAALYDSMTVGENVAFPISRHTATTRQQQLDKAREILTSVGMGDHLDKLPSQISGGMQKRVGLARALALDPSVLLCDEPTAGLDPITSTEIGELIVQLKQQRQMTTIVVTHDIHNARIFANRLILLKEGKIIASGTYEDLANNKDEFVTKFFHQELPQ